MKKITVVHSLDARHAVTKYNNILTLLRPRHHALGPATHPLRWYYTDLGVGARSSSIGIMPRTARDRDLVALQQFGHIPCPSTAAVRTHPLPQQLGLLRLADVTIVTLF